MIEIFINNLKIKVEKNLTVLQACEQASIHIPRFCYHEKLSVAGNCRMCLVEIEKSPKPVAACATPLTSGMSIFTNSPLVKKARESVLEFLLLNHPLDCPICDQGGECDLQDLTINFGSDRSRFFELKRKVEDKNCGPFVKTIMTRCIQCTRCIRFLIEICGVETFGALGRGDLMEIGSFINKHIKTELSGNLVDLCPVGALTSKPYAFSARNWELKKIESVDFLDAFGSNIVIFLKKNTNKLTTLKYNQQILRILPKINENLNENWISDKTRYSFDSLFFNRLENIQIINKNILIKKTFKNMSFNKFMWTFFHQFFLEEFLITNKIGNLGFLVSLEELYFFQQFLNLCQTSNFLINNFFFNFIKDYSLSYQFNSLIKNISQSDLIFLIGTNPRWDSLMLNLRIRKQFLSKEIFIAYLGTIINLTYPVLHLGNSLKNLKVICEGRHKFCQKLRQSKNPFLILGAEIGFRNENMIIQLMYRFLGKKLFLNLKKSCDLNFLHSNISSMHLCFLGINSNVKSYLYCNQKYEFFLYKNMKLLQQYEIKNNFFFNFKIDAFNLKKVYKKKIIFFTTHQLNFNVFKFSDNTFIFPLNTFFEKNALLINIEGNLQEHFKILENPQTRDGASYFKFFCEFLSENLPIAFNVEDLFLQKNLYIENPSLKQNNKKNFYINFLKFKNFSIKIKKTFLKVNINNFFFNNQYLQNSKLMSESSIFFQKEKSFWKNI